MISTQKASEACLQLSQAIGNLSTNIQGHIIKVQKEKAEFNSQSALLIKNLADVDQQYKEKLASSKKRLGLQFKILQLSSKLGGANTQKYIKLIYGQSFCFQKEFNENIFNEQFQIELENCEIICGEFIEQKQSDSNQKSRTSLQLKQQQAADKQSLGGGGQKDPTNNSQSQLKDVEEQSTIKSQILSNVSQTNDQYQILDRFEINLKELIIQLSEKKAADSQKYSLINNPHIYITFQMQLLGVGAKAWLNSLERQALLKNRQVLQQSFNLNEENDKQSYKPDFYDEITTESHIFDQSIQSEAAQMQKNTLGQSSSQQLGQQQQQQQKQDDSSKPAQQQPQYNVQKNLEITNDILKQLQQFEQSEDSVDQPLKVFEHIQYGDQKKITNLNKNENGNANSNNNNNGDNKNITPSSNSNGNNVNIITANINNSDNVLASDQDKVIAKSPLSDNPLSNQQIYENKNLSVKINKLTNIQSQNDFSVALVMINQDSRIIDEFGNEIEILGDQYQKPDENSSIVWNIQHTINVNVGDLRENNNMKLDNIFLIFQIMQDDGEDEVIYGWSFHNLFQNQQVNSGIFSSSIFQPPIQTTAPINLQVLNKMDQKLEFEVDLVDSKLNETNHTNNKN